MKYAVISREVHKGIVEESVLFETDKFVDGYNRWQDEEYYRIRDKKDCENHVVIKKCWEDGNYDCLEDEVVHEHWYAVMMDSEDTDWGTGSYNLDEAKEMLDKELHPDGYIAVIRGCYNRDDEPTVDPVCVDKIYEEV